MAMNPDVEEIELPFANIEATREVIMQLIGRVNDRPVKIDGKLALKECLLFASFRDDALLFILRKTRGRREDGTFGFTGWNRILDKPGGSYRYIKPLDVNNAGLEMPHNLLYPLADFSSLVSQ